MSRRKRKKINRIKLLLIIIIVFGIFIYIKKSKNNDNYTSGDDNVDNIKYDILDKSESDKDIVEKYFMDGMKKSDYERVLNHNNRLISDNNYKYIDYDFDGKLHYSELETLFKKIGSSNISDTYVIGSSVDKRNMYGITIGKGSDVLFIDANIHAAEVSTTLVLTKFLTDLVNEYENGNKDIIDALNRVKIVAIPCMNPDGYEVYNYGVESLKNKELWIYQNKGNINFENIKSNANGVDLNRNFPTQNVGLYYKGYNLIKNTSIDKTTEKGKYFNGYIAGSEPETRASMSFMLKYYKDTYAYINLHSQGRVLYAGKPNLSNEFNDLTKKFANYISSYTSYRVHGLSSEEVGEGNDGSATDFMAELANGFKFSSETGRLSIDKYKNNSCTLEYKYPVVTMEITKTWTSDTSVFKDEYYNHGIKNMLFDLIENNF